MRWLRRKRPAVDPQREAQARADAEATERRQSAISAHFDTLTAEQINTLAMECLAGVYDDSALPW